MVMLHGKFGIKNMFELYKGKRVFLTGNTGFKGSWMAYWLQKIGAEVVGYALPPNTEPNHFSSLKADYNTYFNDVRDLETLSKVMFESKPEIVFHLAAQPLVRYSYHNPIETYSTNVMGTLNVMEAARYCESVKAIVVVTTDKCYENVEQNEGYIETDRMGGFDPYSSSKGCAELAVSSYRNSFFNIKDFDNKHQILLASARAGNVIGGGDWSDDRLIPDLIKSALKGEKANIRYPNATRPWQHVLDPISGYLMLGQKLLNGEKDFAEGWNFGPEENEILTVGEVLEIAKNIWDKINYEVDVRNEHFHEASLLSLNIDKAKIKLGWNPKWKNEVSIQKTIEWYKEFNHSSKIITEDQLNQYIIL
jgi:CDP-glucose 4,6-dehydratase